MDTATTPTIKKSNYEAICDLYASYKLAKNEAVNEIYLLTCRRGYEQYLAALIWLLIKGNCCNVPKVIMHRVKLCLFNFNVLDDELDTKIDIEVQPFTIKEVISIFNIKINNFDSLFNRNANSCTEYMDLMFKGMATHPRIRAGWDIMLKHVSTFSKYYPNKKQVEAFWDAAMLSGAMSDRIPNNLKFKLFEISKKPINDYNTIYRPFKLIDELPRGMITPPYSYSSTRALEIMYSKKFGKHLPDIIYISDNSEDISEDNAEDKIE